MYTIIDVRAPVRGFVCLLAAVCNGIMAGREGRPGIAKWLCINPRAQVGHIPDKVLIIQQVTTFGSAERGGGMVGQRHRYIHIDYWVG